VSADQATITIASVTVGSSETVSITLLVGNDTPDGLNTNTAEISEAMDDLGDSPEDIDSTSDTDPGNDTTVNDEIDNAGGDEDDSDIEEFEVLKLDLALRKTISGDQTTFYPGDLTLDDPNWTASGSTATLTIPGPITGQSSEIVTISFTINDIDANGAGVQVNRAEISSLDNDDDPTNGTSVDIDSTPDNDPDNDTEVNDEIDNAGGDEDDADLEEFDVQIFDLALIKTVEGDVSRVYPGETVIFNIEVFNQGTVEASNILVEDFGAPGLTPTSSTTETIAGPLAPGASEVIQIEFTVDMDATAGTINNIAEIQSAEDPDGNNAPDFDSTPDNDPNNDPNVDDVVDNTGGDEDDNDGEELDIAIFDLASNITLAPGEDDRVYPGETVSFKVTVFNQGTVDAQNVEVTLMIPEGLTSVDGIANMGTITFDAIAVGDMQMQILEFVVGEDITSAGELVIKEEISSAEDDLGNMPTDIDSTPDADFTNDAGGVVDSDTDDTILNENGDEDDNDPENELA